MKIKKPLPKFKKKPINPLKGLKPKKPKGHWIVHESQAGGYRQKFWVDDPAN